MRQIVVLAATVVVFFAGAVGPVTTPANENLSAQEQKAPPPYRPFVVSGDFIHVSGMLPLGPSGTIVGSDIKAQTKQALDNVRAALEKAGARMSDVAAVNVYLKRASDFPAMNEVYASTWPKDPPARTTVVANLVVPEALIEISAVGLRPGAERAVVHPAGWQRSPSPYSYGIRSGATLFLAGLVSRSGRDNKAVTGNMTAQTQLVLDNARAILAEAGMSLADVVAARVYITDTRMFEEMNAAYRQAFPKDPPARATVVTGLTSPDYLVEIALTAVKTADRSAIVPPNADGTPGKPNPNLSGAIRAGNRLFVSGTLGATDATRGNIGEQVRETLTRIGRTLAAAGFAWPQVVESTVFITDVSNFAAMNEAYRSIVPEPWPARATIETRLVSPEGLVEIMVAASK
ncbi:MAG: RidA family protein [Vicinamibacterales bacterium]